jgi:hypothetical protein
MVEHFPSRPDELLKFWKESILVNFENNSKLKICVASEPSTGNTQEFGYTLCMV